MSTYMVRVLDGLARLLGTLPQLTYREDGSAYKPGENPVTFGPYVSGLGETTGS